MKWISFDQYWPASSIKIIITDGENVEVKYWSYVSKDRFELSNGRDATHWMPLPKPPES